MPCGFLFLQHLITKSIAMTNKEILQADMLDILFEHRNKLYGAYALRRTYDRRLSFALGAALLTVLILLGISFLKNSDKNEGPGRNDQIMVLKTIELPKNEPESQPEKEKPKPPVATKDYQPIVVVADRDADSVIVENNDLKDNAIGNKTQDGERPKDDAKAVTVTDDNSDNKSEQKEIIQPDRPSYPPEFPGGNIAWIAFLQKYLQSPDDLEPGQKVEVLVRFWVDIDGSVSRLEIMKSGGSTFDKEVLRVLKKMPKWKPAMQYGNNVAVAYMQPVTFMGVEQ